MSAFIVDYKTIDNILSVRLNPDILINHCFLESEFDSLLGFDYISNFYLDDRLEKLGKEFLTLNIESVNARYPNNDEMFTYKGCQIPEGEECDGILDCSECEYCGYMYVTDYKFRPIEKASLAQAIKSLNCLMYQSCEIDNYKENETYKKMERLKQYLIDAFLCSNDEYKNAKWSDYYEMEEV